MASRPEIGSSLCSLPLSSVVPSSHQQKSKGSEAEYRRRSGSNCLSVRTRLAPEVQYCYQHCCSGPDHTPSAIMISLTQPPTTCPISCRQTPAMIDAKKSNMSRMPSFVGGDVRHLEAVSRARSRRIGKLAFDHAG